MSHNVGDKNMGGSGRELVGRAKEQNLQHPKKIKNKFLVGHSLSCATDILSDIGYLN